MALKKGLKALDAPETQVKLYRALEALAEVFDEAELELDFLLTGVNPDRIFIRYSLGTSHVIVDRWKFIDGLDIDKEQVLPGTVDPNTVIAQTRAWRLRHGLKGMNS